MILRILVKPRPHYRARKVAFFFLLTAFWIFMAAVVLPIWRDFWRGLP